MHRLWTEIGAVLVKQESLSTLWFYMKVKRKAEQVQLCLKGLQILNDSLDYEEANGVWFGHINWQTDFTNMVDNLNANFRQNRLFQTLQTHLLYI